jgi:hypothetical protein
LNKVLKRFRDKESKKIYDKGDLYEHDNAERVAFLVESGFLEGVSEGGTPSFNVADHNSYQSMTKKELMDLLEKQGINFDKSQTKAEMIELLLGGE